jgi:outer membrane protein assembly factor BamB
VPRLPLAIAFVVASVACSRAHDATIWTFRTDRPWFLAGDSQALTPAVDGESVFFCGGYFWDDKSAIHALSLRDGRLLWKQAVGDCESAPWLVAGTLVVHSQAQQNAPCALQGFDPRTGTVRWRHEFPRENGVPIARCSIAHAAAGESIVFSFGDDQYVRSINPASGAITVFFLPPDRSGQRIWMTASGSTAWFGYGTHVWRWVDGSQPEQASELSEDAEPSAFAAADGTLLFLGGGDPAQLRAFDLTTGQVRWGQGRFPEILSMTADGEGLYVNIWRKRFELIAVDTNTGRELWTAGAGGFYAPAKRNGRLYANGEYSVFIADPATGRIERSIAAEYEVITTPVVAGDLMLFGTHDGALHAVRIGD